MAMIASCKQLHFDPGIDIDNVLEKSNQQFLSEAVLVIKLQLQSCPVEWIDICKSYQLNHEILDT